MAERMKKSGRPRSGARPEPGAGGSAQASPACAGELTLPSQSREDYTGAVLEQIGEFEEKLDELESSLESAGWDDIADYRGQLQDLRLRLRASRARSAVLETVPDKEWPELRQEMEAALLDLADSVSEFALLAGKVVPG